MVKNRGKMNSSKVWTWLILIILVCSLLGSCTSLEKKIEKRPLEDSQREEKTELPQPAQQDKNSLEEVLLGRESKRSFTSQKLTPKQISQLCWAAQGKTTDIVTGATRTAPSAGALHPIELYVVTEEGVYHYLTQKHQLEVVKKGDFRRRLSLAAWGQEPIADTPANFVITAVYKRTAVKYGGRAERYVHIEAGHVGQNIFLQATSLGLGSVPIGAFTDTGVQKALSLPSDHKPLLIIPVGYPE